MTFRPDVKLDPRRVRDLRTNPRSPLENVAVRVFGGFESMRQNLGRMIGGRARRLEGQRALEEMGRRQQVKDRARSERHKLRLKELRTTRLERTGNASRGGRVTSGGATIRVKPRASSGLYGNRTSRPRAE